MSNVEVLSGQNDSPASHPAPFNLADYLRRRDEASSFVMVEFGHGPRPVAGLQAEFSGQRAYIGIEAWLRDPNFKKRRHLESLRREQFREQNIFFIDHDLGDSSQPAYNARGPLAYAGKYDPTTLLPDGAADEIFLSNVFGDPHIAQEDCNTRALLHEVSRLVDDEGVIIVRESITPHLVNLGENMLKVAGLKSVADVQKRVHNPHWSELQERFKNGIDYEFSTPGSFYLFLAKAKDDNLRPEN